LLPRSEGVALLRGAIDVRCCVPASALGSCRLAVETLPSCRLKKIHRAEFLKFLLNRGNLRFTLSTGSQDVPVSDRNRAPLGISPFWELVSQFDQFPSAQFTVAVENFFQECDFGVRKLI